MSQEPPHCSVLYPTYVILVHVGYDMIHRFASEVKA
jgi:hypothetical protein